MALHAAYFTKSPGLGGKAIMKQVHAYISLAFVVCLAFAGCGKPSRVEQQRPLPGDILDPDNDAGALAYADFARVAGPVPAAGNDCRIGVVMKFFGNEYWQLLAKGMQAKADEFGVQLDIQAAASESDPAGQLLKMNQMVARNYDAILISPQTEDNLTEGVRSAREAGILVVNVNEAGKEGAEYFVGARTFDSGALVARYMAEQRPEGGQLAVIQGVAGVYATQQRTRGFVSALTDGPFEIVAQVPADWDLQKALNAASALLDEYPGLTGFYANNDVMALGVVQAVRRAGKLGQVLVAGTDGINPAYESIESGELDASIELFPVETGRIAIEVTVRILAGQKVPRVVYTPQSLITRQNASGMHEG